MAGGSGQESLLPMLLMQQAQQIDPLYYGQSYVDDVTNTLSEAFQSGGEQARQPGQPGQPGGGRIQTQSPGSGGGQQGSVRRADGLPSGDDYDETLLKALDYVNSIAGYFEPQHYDYYYNSEGKRTRKERDDPSDADLEFYDKHEGDADAMEQLKKWNKKKKTSESSGGSLLTGGTDMETMFATLLGGAS